MSFNNALPITKVQTELFTIQKYTYLKRKTKIELANILLKYY